MPNIISPGQVDILAGRSTMARIQLDELVRAGIRHKMKMPICMAVLEQLIVLENSLSNPLSNSSPGLSQFEALEKRILAQEAAVGKMGDSSRELTIWTFRFLAFLSFVAVAYFIFIHE